MHPATPTKRDVFLDMKKLERRVYNVFRTGVQKTVVVAVKTEVPCSTGPRQFGRPRTGGPPRVSDHTRTPSRTSREVVPRVLGTPLLEG